MNFSVTINFRNRKDIELFDKVIKNLIDNLAKETEKIKDETL